MRLVQKPLPEFRSDAFEEEQVVVVLTRMEAIDVAAAAHVMVQGPEQDPQRSTPRHSRLRAGRNKLLEAAGVPKVKIT